MRLGLFGGSFDPVHRGHLRLAECCHKQARLDEVWLVPAAVQPHKPHGPVAGDADRVEMLRRATADLNGIEVSTIEVDRGGVSYTVDTLREVAAERPGDDLFFLMGADTLRDLPDWREPAEVLRLAAPLVAHRPGEPTPDFGPLSELLEQAGRTPSELSVVEMPPVDLSSREIRRRLAAGERCDDTLPTGVADWIAESGLYR